MDNQEQWVKIQHKTFMNWCNFCFLSAGVDIRLTNLETDFESGVNLLKLVEVLTQEKLGNYNEKPRMRIHKAVNINVALKKIKESGVIVTQGAEDIIDGNLKLILGLVWMLINRFQINTQTAPGQKPMSAKDNILNWVKEYLKDYPIDLRDFPRCFQDGNIFSYLVHRGHPQLIDIQSLPNKEPLERLDNAFTQAERFGVPKLLSPEDMLISKPDEQSVLTYLSVFRAKVESEGPGDELLPVVQEQLQDIKDIKEDWEKWKAEMQEMLKKIQAESAEKSEQIRQKDLKIKELEDQERQRKEAEDELAKLRAEIAVLQKRLDDAERDRLQAQKDLEEANQRLIDRNRQLEKEMEARSKLSTANEEVDFWKKKYEKVKAKHKKEKARIAELEEELRKLREEMENSKNAREKGVAEIEDQRDKLQVELENVKKNNDAELEELRRQLAEKDRLLEEGRREQEVERERSRNVELQRQNDRVEAGNTDELQREIDALKKALEAAKSRNALELIIRELYFRKGRRTDFGTLQQQYEEDKALEDACVQAKQQVKHAISHEKQSFHANAPNKKGESDYEKSVAELRKEKHNLKSLRTVWAQEYNALGDLYQPKTTVEEKLEAWREKLVPIADDPVKLGEAASELQGWMEEVSNDLKEDNELNAKLEDQKQVRQRERGNVTSAFSSSSQKLENRRVAELERLENLLKGGNVLDQNACNAVQKMIENFAAVFSKFEEDVRNNDVHQLVTKPISWMDVHGLKTADLLAKEDYKVAAVAQIKAYAYKGYSIDLSKVKDPFVIAQVLKGYFKDLTEPLLTWSLYDEFAAIGAESADATLANRLRRSVHRLPNLRRATLTVLIGFLHRVAQNSKENYLTPQALGRIFGPLLMRAPAKPAQVVAAR